MLAQNLRSALKTVHRTIFYTLCSNPYCQLYLIIHKKHTELVCFLVYGFDGGICSSSILCISSTRRLSRLATGNSSLYRDFLRVQIPPHITIYYIKNSSPYWTASFYMAEKEGFEPSLRKNSY